MIDWIGSVFTRPPDKEMRGLEWGRLYELYHSQSYDAAKIDADVNELRADPTVVTNGKGIYEYLLGGKKDTQLLGIRLFDKNTKRVAYQQQTSEATVSRRVQLPAVRDGQRQQQDSHLQAGRDGR